MKSTTIFLRSVILTLISLSFIAAGIYTSRAADTTTDNYNVTMKDGTVLVGAIQIKKVEFKASYGAVEVNLNDVMTFNDGFLTLNDGSKLKGNFANGNLGLETARGEMNLPFESITAITRPNAPAGAPATSVTPIKEDSIKPKGLRMGMEYQNNEPTGSPVGGGYVYGSQVYIFGNQGVSVYYVVGNEGNIFLNKREKVYITSNGLGLNGGHPKGTFVGNNLEVVCGPGDRIAVLENAPFKVEGTSVYVDWSQNHGKYFPLSFCKSGSEVFTIKNDGLVLESATKSGFSLTLNILAVGGTAGESQGDASVASVQSSSSANPPAQEGAPLSSAMANSIIAKGQGFEIKRSQLDQVIIGRQSAAAAHGQTISPEQLSVMEKQTLNRLIQIQLLFQKATDDDIANGKKNAEAQINTLLDRAGTQEKLGQQLKTSGMTIDEFRSKITQEATATAVLQRELGSGTKMTGDEAEKYMNKLEKEAGVEILDPNLKLTPFDGVTASVPYATLFANHSREYSFAYDKVWGAVSSFLTSQHEKVIESNEEAGVLMTDLTSHVFLGLGYYDKYCILIEKLDDNTSRVTLKLLRYELAVNGQKTPSSGEVVNPKAEAFLNKIDKQLKTTK